MKNSKTTILVVTIAVLVLLGAYQQGKLNADAQIQPAKIGIVNMTRVFEESAMNQKWKEKMQQEQTDARNEMKKMQTDLEAMQANLQLRTPGSEDYLELYQKMIQQKAVKDAREAVYREKYQQMLPKKKDWILLRRMS